MQRRAQHRGGHRRPLQLPLPATLLLLAAALAALARGARGAAPAAGLSVSAAFPCKSPSQFFDISALECAACDAAAGYVRAPDGLRCMLCDPSAGNDTSFANGFSLTSSWAPAQPAAAGTACACAGAASGGVLASVVSGGLALQRCVSCPAGTAADAAAGVCTPPSGPLDSPARDLAYVLASLNAKGASILAATATQAVIQDVAEPSGGARAYSIVSSAPLAALLGPSARSCMDAASREGCNALANLCVLQLYSPDAAACQIYDELVAAVPGAARQRASASSSGAVAASPRPVTGPLPWLYYASGSPYTTATDLDFTASLSSSAPALRFVLAAYDINGTWLGLHNWTLQLQVCGASVREGALWTRFGVGYAASCSVDASALLAQLDYSSNGPRFYDPYLVQDSGRLYPLPIRLLNKENDAANTASGDGSALPTGHVRRLFFIDASLSRSAAGEDGAPQALVFPSELSLAVTIQADARDHILPPVLTLRYSALRASDATPGQPARFAVAYGNPPALSGAFWSAWQTILIVLLLLVGGPAWAWRVLRYVRQQGAAPLDLELLLYGGAAAADVFSGVLVLVLFVVSVYWLVLVKLQEAPLLLMVPDEALYNFWVTVVLALVGQSLGVLLMLWRQVNVDIFFIDWEAPRRVLAKGGGREEPGPVSAWRGLLVANEWNELQAARLTSPAFTLLAVVCILQGAGMASAATINPNQDDYNSYANVQQSMLLRFAIAAVWCAVVSLAQVLWKVLLVHRFAGHPLHGFVDLLFLANTSAVILDDRRSGHYLHGRNQLHHSDTSLAELNASLLREEEGLVAGRGLVSSYTGSAVGPGGLLGAGPSAAALNDNQVFLLQVSPELRQRYETMLLSHVEQAAQEQRMNKGAVTAAVRGPQRPRGSAIGASAANADAFRAAIDEAERNHPTQVLIPTYMQRVLRLPPPAVPGATLLTHDLHNSFASVLLLGQELRLAAHEGLLFAGLHMSLGNAAAAGFITLLVQRVLAWARRHWGEHNLSRKTLVDRHFLI